MQPNKVRRLEESVQVKVGFCQLNDVCVCVLVWMQEQVMALVAEERQRSQQAARELIADERLQLQVLASHLYAAVVRALCGHPVWFGGHLPVRLSVCPCGLSTRKQTGVENPQFV